MEELKIIDVDTSYDPHRVFIEEKIKDFKNLPQIIVNKEGRYIGAIELRKNKRSYIIDSLEIVEEYRRLGYGSKLIYQLLDEDNVEFIYLEACKKALPFYRSLKYNEVLYNEFESVYEVVIRKHRHI